MPQPTSERTKSSTWTVLSPNLLKAAAYIIIIATIVEDIVTLGVGVADDAASFALAASLLRLAASRPVVNSVIRTGPRIMIQGSRSTAGASGVAALAY